MAEDKVVKLADGPHRMPGRFSFGSLSKAGEYLPQLGDKKFKLLPRHWPALFAALLTEMEPLDEQGDPQKVWSPTEAGRLMLVEEQDHYDTYLAGLFAQLQSKDDKDKEAGSGEAPAPKKRTSRGGAKPSS